ncbi:sigma-70 family RNA polymerase sigma factor [Curtobacterium sp. A7_M15]|uniref:RNA polymerase sigma factor n=1 Tax=Curtobacterium sp. A7_M15 TaxID=3065241 RepID=UPI0027379307|nr:sigma-70 family RNA polymerase sigma factor [Curtobacterium sp. A7_M15]MDP4333588.1 sigma-70 family RNA polymerase sigma factor [Curtobacterium sp. A7_M15]
MTAARCRRDATDERHDRLVAAHQAAYADLVRYFTRRGAANDADELTAEVFVIAWRGMPDDLDDPRPWLFGVARKVLGNARRRHQRRQGLDVPLEHDDGAERTPSVTTHSGPIALRVDVQRAWNRLSPADQELLALIAWEGLTTVEAAAVLGLKRSSAAMRLKRARERLRAHLEPAHPEPVHPATARQEAS